jgi:hypothetical protein
MVIAVIALSFALVGSAFAGTDALKRAITKSKVKSIAQKQANKVLNQRASSLNVASAASATNASQLGGSAAANYQKKADLLSATVSPANAAPVLTAGRGATAVSQVATGFFNVTFNRDISACTATATYGDELDVSNGIDSKFATVRGPGGGADPTKVGVVIWDDAGAQVNGDGFHLLVLCP